MRPLHVAILFAALTVSGCIDMPARWENAYMEIPGRPEKAHEDRQAAIDGRCRNRGFISGSSKFELCSKMQDQGRNQREQDEQDAAIEAMRTSSRTYSKDAGQAKSRPIWTECKTTEDGQHSCVGR